MKIKDYQILSGLDEICLQEQVMALIGEGYKPLGGVATVSHSRPQVVQAMILEDDE